MTEFHAGDLVGDYRLEARLGHGGFGTVWRARHAVTGRLVALKVLPENDSLQASSSLRADVELLAASAASASPHIVRVLGGGIDPVPHVIMEFVNGVSLAEEIKTRGKLTHAEVIDIGLGIAEALAALQGVGIVHRDVKPSNVLIDRGGTVKLTDFGIAKIAGYEAVTATGQLPLSIAYAAPEVWEGKAEHRSDLYALGVLLYQCLTGSLPFRGAYAELFYQHRSQAPDLTALPPGTPHSLIDLINLSLRKDPGERPAGAATCTSLLLQARTEMETATVEEVLVEPGRFGPWIKGERHETQPWAWHCTEAESGAEAVVEVHFATDAAYGEALRLAVAANEALAALGAERLLQTNRLILRPGEAWTSPPAGQFQFWVARDELQLPEPPQQVTAAALLSYTEALQDLLDAAATASVPLRLTKETLRLLPDGSVHLRRPGLDFGYAADAEGDALAYLRAQPLSREVRPLVSRARTLEDLRLSLERLQSLSALAPGATPQRRPKPLALAGLGVMAAVLIAIVAVWQLAGGGSEDSPAAIAPSPTAPVPTSVPTACDQLPLPAPLVAVTSSCTGSAVAFELDAACPTGVVCRRQPGSGGTTLYVNDLVVAYVDADGGLVTGRENNLQTVFVRRPIGPVEAIDWSPDGRYLAYLVRVPAGAQTAANTPATSTQLWVIDPSRPGSNALLLATNDVRDSLQRLISTPQWSADGRSIVFLWSTPGQPGGEVFALDMPLTAAGEIDYTKVRLGVSPSETYISSTLRASTLASRDFGVATAHLGGVHVTPDGRLFVQLCRGTGAGLGCGIGVWDGTAATVLAPAENGVFYGLPVASPADGVLHAARFQAGEWGLVRIDATGISPVPGIRFIGDSASAPDFTISRDGSALIYETEPGVLGLVGFSGGNITVWAAGAHPAWYVAPSGTAQPPVPSPPATAYATPVLTPTPSVFSTPTPLPAMTLLVTVLDQRGVTVSGARVVAFVSGNLCTSVSTGPGPAQMTFPDSDAAAACRQSGVTITFTVNEKLVVETIPYQPGISRSVTLRQP